MLLVRWALINEFIYLWLFKKELFEFFENMRKRDVNRYGEDIVSHASDVVEVFPSQVSA